MPQNLLNPLEQSETTAQGPVFFFLMTQELRTVFTFLND